MLLSNFKKLSLLTVAATTLSLHATNGDQMIAVGTKSMGMGGVSIAMPFGAESGLCNPALITYVDRSEVSGSLTVFLPDIKAETSLDNQLHKSKANFFLMPALQYATQLENGIYIGAGLWDVGGMGVDYSNADGLTGLLKMQTNLMLMQIAIPVAIRKGGLSGGIAPLVQVGMLDIKYQSPLHGKHHPIDKQLDAHIGATMGLTYDFNNGLILGAKYRTPITMKYSSMKLEQPYEAGVGFSYHYKQHTIAFDYKKIAWESADGYRQVGWQDQNVYAMGYQYATEQWALRLGYNHGESAVDTSHLNSIQDYINLLGFPATSVNHYTLGASYKTSESVTVDFATIYSPNKKSEGKLLNMVLTDIENHHSELSFTVQVDYEF